jgi:hypothetical protein
MKISLPIISRFVGKIDPLHLLVGILSIFGGPSVKAQTPPSAAPNQDALPLLPLPTQAFSTTLWTQETFAQQTALIDTLPTEGCPTAIKSAIKSLAQSSDPFNDEKTLPTAIEASLTRYNLFKTSTDSDMVIKRHARVRKDIWGVSHTLEEETEVLVGLKDSPPVLLRLKHEANGDLIPLKMEHKAISEHTKELENSKTGLVVSAKRDCNPGYIGDLSCAFEANKECFGYYTKKP